MVDLMGRLTPAVLPVFHGRPTPFGLPPQFGRWDGIENQTQVNRTMTPLLKSGNNPVSPEDLLQTVSDSLSKLEHYLSALSRMHFDNDLTSDEFNAIMCGLHLQVHEICQQIKA